MAGDNTAPDVRALLDPRLFGAPRSVEQVLTGSVMGAAGPGVADQIGTMAEQLREFQTVSQTGAQSVQENTQAVNRNTTQLGQSGPPAASRVSSTLEGALGLGLGLGPLITGVLSLFGGGGGTQPAPLSTFVLPPPVNINAGVREAAPTDAFGVDYAAGGQARPVTSGGPAQITVQVQAMDSRSFLDHSKDIALAVRQAMLESGVLNDVVREV